MGFAKDLKMLLLSIMLILAACKATHNQGDDLRRKPSVIKYY